MNTNTLEADYLVVGSGAMGMAFTDVLLTESDATVVMVDRHHRPGGHWNLCYPFVRLHQPSYFYGVNSRRLGRDGIDQTGWNKGFYELASGSEVCAYFDQVMQEQFLPTGRIRYFPMCEYTGGGRFASRTSGTEHQVRVAKKIVDATYMNVTVPAMQKPSYKVARGAKCVPPNDLARVQHPPDGYVVIGAGKTGMDACLWLLANEVDPDSIAWIMPRDAWLLNRASFQPTSTSPPGALGGRDLIKPFLEADSIDDLYAALHASGFLLRLDDRVRPTMFRCATVTEAELEQLGRIKRVVRKGRVTALEPDEIILERGSIPTSKRTLHIDCTADGLEKRPAVPIFAGDQLTLQSVRMCQQVFSAAFIAHVEASYEDDVQKNDLCTPVPHPNTHLDFIRITLARVVNETRWASNDEIRTWLSRSRLNGIPLALGDPAEPGAELPDAAAGPAMMQGLARLQKLVAEADAEEGA